MTKITRKQQEILIVNGKTISVEGGVIVNAYDLDLPELVETLRFLNDSYELHKTNRDK